ncbi:MAG: MBL fold metallo-hydrolase [Anaerolineales bacterium]|nr:MBL fold metallo-hydrolase [Anaerolineales bacterium]
MLRERVSEDIYVFTSEVYAQVTAGVVVCPDGAALIDTMAFPFETAEIKDFVEKRLNTRVEYVIYTHYHADHTNGAFLFPQARVIGHRLCRERLDTVGREGMAKAKEQSNELSEAEIVLPTLLLDEGPLALHLAKKTLQVFPTPGATPDSVSVLLREDRILFAGDMMMPLPYIVDGDLDEMIHSLQLVPGLGLENVVQGHGELVLRGEIDDAVRSNIKYLETARRKVEQLVKRGKPRQAVRGVDIESCGKSRIPLNGLVTQLHTANLYALYDRLTAERDQ